MTLDTPNKRRLVLSGLIRLIDESKDNIRRIIDRASPYHLTDTAKKGFQNILDAYIDQYNHCVEMFLELNKEFHIRPEYQIIDQAEREAYKNRLEGLKLVVV